MINFRAMWPWWRAKLWVYVEEQRPDGSIDAKAPVWLEPGDGLSISDDTKREQFRIMWEHQGAMRVRVQTTFNKDDPRRGTPLDVPGVKADDEIDPYGPPSEALMEQLRREGRSLS